MAVSFATAPRVVTIGGPAPLVAQGVATPDPATLYPPAPLFDFETGDFVRDGAGRIVMADGYTAWAQRCLKRILTRRGSSLLYAPAFGTLLDLDLKVSGGRSHQQQAVEQDIRSQLPQDPATKSVDQFAWSYTANRAALACVITPTIGPPQTLVIPPLTVAGR